MNQYMTHLGNKFPWSFRMFATESVCQFIGSFTYYFNTFYNAKIFQIVNYQLSLCFAISKVEDTVNSFYDML